LRTPPPSYGTSLIAINELLLQAINASTVALHYTGLEMRFLDLCGFPDAMTSTTVKDGLIKILSKKTHVPARIILIL
jgi:C4-dicarboxylate transporter